MTYRNRRLLDLAHAMQRCQVQVPNVCQGESIDGLEPAHGNWQWLNRGVGHKADDVFAAACPACHRWIDSSGAAQGDREYYWMRGAINTWRYLMANGWLEMSGKRTVEGRR